MTRARPFVHRLPGALAASSVLLAGCAPTPVALDGIGDPSAVLIGIVLGTLAGFAIALVAILRLQLGVVAAVLALAGFMGGGVGLGLWIVGKGNSIVRHRIAAHSPGEVGGASGKDEWPIWFAGLQREGNLWPPRDPAAQARMLDWLRQLKANGVDLGVRAGPFKECLLDKVIEGHSAEIVILALDAGCDPEFVPTGPHDWPAVARWVERRFRNLHGCAYTIPLSSEQIAAIDARMSAIGASQINRPERANGRTLLHIVAEMKDCDDGGAAAFAHLLSHGADLGLASNIASDAGFLAGLQGLHPALAAELNKLDDRQIQRLAHPVQTGSGDRAAPLLPKARAMGNLALVDLLCSRGIKGCS